MRMNLEERDPIQQNQPTSAEVEELIALFNGRRHTEAESRTRALLGQYPDFAYGWKLLGSILQMEGEDAVPAFQIVTELTPDDAEAHYNLGVVLKSAGQLDNAVASYRRAVALKSDFALAYYNLGNALKELGQLDDALVSYRRVIGLRPDFVLAYLNLGNALKELGRLDDAVISYRRVIEIKPDFAEAHNNLGIALKELCQFDAARTSYRQALKIKLDYAEAHNNLGSVLKELGQLDQAVASYRRAIEIKPDYAEAYSNLGIVLTDIGQHDEAVASYRRALEINPDYAEAQSNLLFALNYTVHTTENCLEEARKYGRMVDGKVTSRFSTWQCALQPQDLRVGMVSGDLHNHPVGYFLEGLLSQIGPARIELIAYPNDMQVDALTARIKPYFAAWKPLFNMSDEAAARLIHADGVHVLLDLSGHTGKNRLPVFARKPAPVQASWLGYFATTGVSEMDYLLADEVCVPQANRRDFSETVWYMPGTRWCFTPPEVNLPVASLPALNNGFVTFGCFHNLAKVGSEVLTVWGRIFSALPNARLRWQCKQLGDHMVAAQFGERLRQQGIDSARVTLHGEVSREAYLEAHAEVDALLDTFPFPGGTTTCEALWMGVPTLTLAGDTLLARQGASMLTAAGLGEWVATSEADYIDKAVVLSGDLPKLAALRAGLREQVRSSPLYDAKRFAKNFESALWGMWRTRTQRNSTAPECLTAP